MLRFVATDSDGLPLKRKQSQRACDICRKRKKRCVHLRTDGDEDPHDDGGLPSSADTIPGNHPASRPSSALPKFATTRGVSSQVNFEKPPKSAPHPNPMMIGSALATSPSNEDGDGSRFVGDLNPEGIFLSTASPETNSGPIDDSVGVWVPRHALQPHARRNTNTSMGSPGSIGSTAGPLLSQMMLPSLEDQCVRILPSQVDFNALRHIYIEEFHPVFPIIDLQVFDKLPHEANSKIVLKQAICLAASSNLRSRPYLRLPNHSTNSYAPLSAKAFAEQLVQALRMLINIDFIKDKLVLIQVLALLSMCTQFSDDRHSSAELNSRAVSYAQTVGIHLNTSATRGDHVYVTRLFCCVWVLDRLNAAFHGRPVVMHERDIGRNLQTDAEQQEGAFQLLLRIVLLLDKVIGIYRPLADSNNQTLESFPAFEDLLDQNATLRAPAHLLATVETLYHATAMLSYRSRNLSELSWSSHSHLRQSLSATNVTSIVGGEFAGQLSLFPFVPYAVTLSLRVSYIALRFSKSPYMRIRARRQVLNICTMLRDFGDVFATSIHMAELAEQTVNEMDKVYTSMITQRKGSMAPNSQVISTLEAADSAIDPEAINGNAGPPPNREVIPENTEPQMVYQQYIQDPYDSLLFEDLPDLNVFDHFNPDFDLDAIDAALADGIDPSWFALPMETVRSSNM